jgi:hypothetical protein
VDQLGTPAVEEGLLTDEEGIGPFTSKSCECRIDVADGAGFENLDLQPDGASCRSNFSQRCLGILSVGRIDQNLFSAQR